MIILLSGHEKIKSLAPYRRPREKAIMNGIDSLSNEELLSLIIRCGTKEKSSIDLANEIIDHLGEMERLNNCDVYDLMKIKGIKEAKALEIVASIELVKRINKLSVGEIEIISNARDAYNLVYNEMKNLRQENFLVLFLNIKQKVIKKERLFIGGDIASFVDVNLIFKKAIECGAKKIICLHNHPSGDPTPSEPDLLITQRIKSLGEFLKIYLLDHLIIGNGEFISFKEKELL